jgi:soluble lytic murein transglycosylase-like protein
MRAAILVAMMLVLALPAEAHTEAEQREWETEWIERVRHNGGLSRSLLDEYLEFQIAHTPQTPTPSHSSTYRGMGPGVEQWRSLVAAYFGDQTDRALCIMAKESGGNPNARNPKTGAAGLFQVMPFWWDHYGGDRYHPETNIRVASKILAQQGWRAWSPWNRGHCR